MGLFDGLFGRGSADAKLRDQIFNLKFTAKSLARAAKKCEAEERANKVKVRRREVTARADADADADARRRDTTRHRVFTHAVGVRACIVARPRCPLRDRVGVRT